jgi:heterodisulfide reductase subunit A
MSFPPASTELPPKGTRRVAVVGSGPSGLTAAQDLVKMGYGVTVFEALPVAGGMMRVGIPEHRLPKDILQRDIDAILALGVELRLNSPIGDPTALLDEGYDAVFLATGITRKTRLGIEGEDLEGVLSGIAFLREVNLGRPPRIGQKVAVVGGGITAVDAATTALRLGAKEVSLIYRRSRGEIPAYEWEQEEAEKEGVRLVPETVATRITSTGLSAGLGEGGKVTGLECARSRQLSRIDISGKRAVVPEPGTEFTLEVDTVIVAIGQFSDLWHFEPAFRGLIGDERTLATMYRGIFASRGIIPGAGFVINAVALGHEAAASIDHYLRGEPLEPPEEVARPVEKWTKEEAEARVRLGVITPQPRIEPATLPLEERRGNFKEIALPLTEEQARAEAARCLNCGLCAECYQCVWACEREAVDHHMRETFAEIEVGAIVLATGFELFDVRRLPQYGYSRWDNVYTALEVERLTNASGPTGGEILMRDGRPPDSVAILHCIGSRDRHTNRYCSRVCCMYSMKLAHLIREKTHARVYEFYFDITAFGKGYAEFHERVQEEGVLFVRGKAAEVEEIDGKLVVRAEDTLLGEFVEVPVDMVVLSSAMVPVADVEEVAQLFRISRGEDGFFLEAHPKLRPVETSTDGIFLAGCCQGPKDIPDTVAQASGAAAQALGLLNRGYIETEPMTAEVTTMRCVGCGLCVEVCPTGAIELKEWRPFQHRAEVNAALCKGCGLCVAACRGEAITLHGFTDQQLLAQLRSLLMPEMVG